MQKFKVLLITTCLGLIFAGCSKTEDREVGGPNGNQSENTSEVKESADMNEEEQNNNGPTEEPPTESTEETGVEEEKEPGLTIYRPEVGTIKKFTDGEEIVLTEEVIAIKDEYVQFSLTLGANQTIQIYKWTADELTLVYEEVAVEDSSINILDSFSTESKQEILLSTIDNQVTTWELVENGVELEVNYGKFENVYVIQKITDEVENADTIYTRYYAPGIGLIKEHVELTGEYGYSGETELATVEN
ncbi:hypothetical protein [Sutcliffiella rhizosphaerae]|uniref:hypothetical protein n=1 Tax=Sutcliffiella rhizosphaerae TaxID=2880967 RepID=UPI001E2A3AC3|nr:hypothetical protein [Sutcliffiella rhizosphaerae]